MKLFAAMLQILLAALWMSRPVQALTITPEFDASITSAANAADIESTINLAISIMDGLYANPGTVGVLFTLGKTGSLGESNSGIDALSYSGYTGLLEADSLANPANMPLVSAIANLPFGNDASGNRSIVASTALLRVGLGVAAARPCFDASGAVIVSCGGSSTNAGINDSTVDLSTILGFGGGPSSSGVNVTEHELDEVLGGGGQGSNLNYLSFCTQNPSSSVCNGLQNDYAPLDLYRYAASGADCTTIERHTPSYTTDTTKTACLSIDGGTTAVVQFNQNAGVTNPAFYGDFGDFAPAGSAIQSAFTCCGTTFSYLTSSPEYVMLESIGWDPVTGNSSLPEPGSIAVFGFALTALAARRRLTPGNAAP